MQYSYIVFFDMFFDKMLVPDRSTLRTLPTLQMCGSATIVSGPWLRCGVQKVQDVMLA